MTCRTRPSSPTLPTAATVAGSPDLMHCWRWLAPRDWPALSTVRMPTTPPIIALTADYRPGSRAAEELGIRAPLREADLAKAEVRTLSGTSLRTHVSPFAFPAAPASPLKDWPALRPLRMHCKIPPESSFVNGLSALRDLTSRLLCAILSAGLASLGICWHPGLAAQRRRM
jgi:hypothetical protein